MKVTRYYRPKLAIMTRVQFQIVAGKIFLPTLALWPGFPTGTYVELYS
jgi:hypothetical protein